MITKKGNKLIAEFMTDEPEVLAHDLKKAGTLESMDYHDMWDWLMPVVEKIESLGFQVYMVWYPHTQVWQCTIYDKDQLRCLTQNGGVHADKMKITWKSVIEFIQWYNTQK